MSETNIRVTCALYPHHKGYTSYEEALKARKRKYGSGGPGAEPTFLCECGRYHVDIVAANQRAIRA
jgi:hypothetical protein